MKSVSTIRWAMVVYLVLVFPSLIVLPFMVSLTFNAASEAVLGNKEPVFATGLGLLAGIIAACWLATHIPVMWRTGWKRASLAFVAVILAYELLAIPLARWMIRAALSSPTNVINS